MYFGLDVMVLAKAKTAKVIQSVNDGKKLLVKALTDKGIISSIADTFEDIAKKISEISGRASIAVNVDGERLIFSRVESDEPGSGSYENVNEVEF